MLNVKRFVTLFSGTSQDVKSGSLTGNWIRLDNRYGNLDARAIHVVVSGGDSVAIQATTKDVKGIDETYITNIASTDYGTVNTLSANGEILLEGPYSWIRVVKTGTAANCVVEGFV